MVIALLRNYLFLLFSFLLTVVPALAQLGPKDGAGLPATDLERIKTGQAAPDFTLQNQDGKNIRLSNYRGRKVVLVFYRGHW